ncbi:unnamed protein product [Urochloa humidicola]
MPRPGPDHAPLAEMTAVELEATLAALPGKRDALREAFDRLAACSPRRSPSLGWTSTPTSPRSTRRSRCGFVRSKHSRPPSLPPRRRKLAPMGWEKTLRRKRRRKKKRWWKWRSRSRKR